MKIPKNPSISAIQRFTRQLSKKFKFYVDLSYSSKIHTFSDGSNEEKLEYSIYIAGLESSSSSSWETFCIKVSELMERSNG